MGNIFNNISIECNPVPSAKLYVWIHLLPYLYCDYSFEYSTQTQSATFQFMQTGYDTLLFVLVILNVTSEASRRMSKDCIRYKMARDGVLYYRYV